MSARINSGIPRVGGLIAWSVVLYILWKIFSHGVVY